MRDRPSPVTTPPDKRRKFFQELLIGLVESVQLCAVDVNDSNRHQLSCALLVRHDGHDDLAPAVAVTGDVAGKLLYIIDQLGDARLGRGATNTSPKSDRLAGHLSLERPENQLSLLSCG